ncbi:hypothetical protein ACFQ0D_24790, partial [Micromonospora zhanjiangensis]
GPAVAAQTLLVLGLLEDEGMPRSELDDFLTAAENLARRQPAVPAAGLVPDPADEPVPDPAP